MNHRLPLVFVFLMALSTLTYVVLDGYDLGVGHPDAPGQRRPEG